MIICECLGLTDSQIQKKLEQGACRLSDLAPKSALEGCCGGCVDLLKAMIRENRKAQETGALAARRGQGLTASV